MWSETQYLRSCADTTELGRSISRRCSRGRFIDFRIVRSQLKTWRRPADQGVAFCVRPHRRVVIDTVTPLSPSTFWNVVVIRSRHRVLSRTQKWRCPGVEPHRVSHRPLKFKINVHRGNSSVLIRLKQTAKSSGILLPPTSKWPIGLPAITFLCCNQVAIFCGNNSRDYHQIREIH